MFYKNTVTDLMLTRQHFTEKADREQYNDLFRLMSPVQTQYWTRPGNPPELVFRAGFMEYQHVFDMRSRRIIVKGRFQGGMIGYIFADELPLFASGYARKRISLSFKEIEILEMLESEGPMTVAMMRELTGWRAKEITPVLHKLQERFLVFEDQVDNEWDRAWYPFDAEFPDVDLNSIPADEALRTLIMRFTYLNVLIDTEMLRSFYRLPAATIKEGITYLVDEGKLSEISIGQETGLIRTKDAGMLEKERHPARGIFALHRNDFLVRSHEHRLKQRFNHPEYSTLQYLLIDGEFKGFTTGHFKNGPFIIEDIVLDICEKEAAARQAEIIAAVNLVNDAELSPVRRYQGIKL